MGGYFLARAASSDNIHELCRESGRPWATDTSGGGKAHNSVGFGLGHWSRQVWSSVQPSLAAQPPNKWCQFIGVQSVDPKRRRNLFKYTSTSNYVQ
jgi:hypothetical protein